MQSTSEAHALSRTYEDFLANLELCISQAGQLQLFLGDQLRLEIMLLRHEKNPHVIWGLKRHEDWAFKATLLRFARGRQPVRLILITETGGVEASRGWVVRRTMERFWASPLTAEDVHLFWQRHIESYSAEPQG
jgi:hypothetical protein